MGNVKLLDCTLRDGGYINDWRFGKEAITGIIGKLEDANVDIIELGFLKNEPYNENRTVFNSMEQVKSRIKNKKQGIQYAAMIEVINPLPIELLESAHKDSVDIIRVIVWKRLLKEGFDYCKRIKEKGYKLCIQPARVEQYTKQEFIDMIKLFNQIDPLALYIVDSWGTQYSNDMLKFAQLADQYLEQGIAIGYHGHNNLMQAFGAAEEFLKSNICRDKIIDASVYGIGRGAGNLNMEIITGFLNEFYGKDYVILPLIEIYEKFLKRIYDSYPWGYSMPYFITAKHHCNPNYASYYGIELGLSASIIDKILNDLSEEDKIFYTVDKAKHYLKQFGG